MLENTESEFVFNLLFAVLLTNIPYLPTSRIHNVKMVYLKGALGKCDRFGNLNNREECLKAFWLTMHEFTQFINDSIRMIGILTI